ncbi:YrvL family regulatory protein [Niallia sp. 01092]|uniref:YrvL family regulatory protein n=1 Tax=unclassified Niallia TaxID=2837522 RepID=UPI003FD20D5D
MNSEKPFRNETLKSKIFIISIITFLILFALAFVFATYYFGLLGFFKLLHVQYDSFYTLFLFVLFYLLLGIIGEIIFKLLNTLIHALIPTAFMQFFTEFLLNYFVNWAIIFLLDSWMDSIQIGEYTQILAAALISLIELVVEKSGKKNENT